jgi:acyl carrier protein
LPAQNEVSDVLAREWCNVLGVDAVREEDDFFTLGGNSLLAVTLVERVEEQLGIEFPLESMFIGGTFGAVLSACQEQLPQ